MTSATETTNDVLVVGDWYVDAHWVVAPHESETASRPGARHSLAVHDIGATVRTLSGAGQVANLLTTGFEASKKVFGLGSWARGDDGYIQALMEGTNVHDNPLRLSSSASSVDIEKEPTARRVYNIAPDDTIGTNRVIRVYRRRSPSDYDLVDRIDFSTPTRDPEVSELPQTVGHILLKDHGNGVVTPRLIRELRGRYPGASWYVCTKRWGILSRPASPAVAEPWFESLKGADVRLIMFQAEAAQSATILEDPDLPHVGNWLIDAKVPTRRALTALEEVFTAFSGDETAPHAPALVVLPSRHSLIARFVQDGKAFGYVSSGTKHHRHHPYTPRASAVFASLFFSYTQQARGDWQLAIKQALEFAALWIGNEARRIEDPGWIRNSVRLARGGAGIAVIAGRPPNDDQRRDVEPEYATAFDWDHVIAEYRQAFDAWPSEKRQGFGVIARGKDDYHLELWRTMSVVDGLICVMRAKRRMLGQLSREFEQFARTRRTSKSFMIVDDPGGGKSTLVKKLASSKGLRVLSVNITELTRRADLLAFFDTVVTTQAQSRGEPPLLVFVDEINAQLERDSVYSAFLAPLEDGHYNRDGKSFTILPCVWVFVGTDDFSSGAKQSPWRADARAGQVERLIAEARRAFGSSQDGSLRARRDKLSTEAQRAEAAERAQKKSDFLSRLTLPPFVLNQPFALTQADDMLTAYVQNLVARLASEDTREATLRVLIESAMTEARSSKAPERLLGRRLLKEGLALERIYIGASMIIQEYPSVETISLRVLAGFGYVEDGYSLRDLRHDLERMRNVQRNCVVWANLPASFHGRLGFNRQELATGGQAYGRMRPLHELCEESLDKEMVRIQATLSRNEHPWTGLQREGLSGAAGHVPEARSLKPGA